LEGEGRAKMLFFFLAWILLHRKILTANNLTKRGEAGHMMEAVQHLAGNSHTLMQKLHLVVWTQLSSWLNLSHLPPIDSATTIYGWWTKCRARVQKVFCVTLDGVLIYFWWNIWKECNRQTFNNDFKQVIDAAYLIKDGILQFATAHLGSAFTTTDS